MDAVALPYSADTGHTGTTVTKPTYSEQLKHPKWQRRRLEIMERADFRCEDCDATEKTFHVHHKLYRKGAMAWEYEDHELACLCEDCHSAEHRTRERLKETLAHCSSSQLEVVLGFAQGLVAESGESETLSIDVQSFEQAEGLRHAFRIDDPFCISRFIEGTPWTARRLAEAASEYRPKTEL